jgi:hypothetical protein
MRITGLLTAIVATIAVGCDSPTRPETAAGPYLEPDGVVASMNSLQSVTARVTGSAHRERPTGEPIILSFSAVQRGDGTVNGSYTYHDVGGRIRIRVDVTCMSVVGNQGFVAGTIVDGTPNVAGLIGTVSYFYTRDNGEGAGADSDEVSLVRAGDVPEAAEEFCTERPTILPNREVLRGNVNVTG